MHRQYQAISQCVVMALTVGMELFINIRITYCKLKSPACVVNRGVKRRHAVVSYQCTIGNMKTQHEDELKPQVWVVNDLQGTSTDIFGLIYKILFHFI